MSRRSLLPAAVLLVLTVLALPSLVEPYGWDQAMFALGGEVVATGGALYRDYWDFKPPGVFLFFAAAHAVAGRAEWAAHAFEAGLWLALAWLLARGTGAVYTRPATAAWAPLLVCGTYFALADDWRLLQVEGLLALPLTTAWLAARRAGADARSWPWALVAGLAGGVVLITKPVYAPVVVVLAAPALVRRWRARGIPAAAVTAATMLAAAVLPVAATAAHLASRGALALAWEAVAVAPFALLARVEGLPLANWSATLGWIVREAWPLLLLAALGTAVALRQRDAAAECVLWCGVGAVCLLVQRWSGWPHHLWLLLVPAGLLALRGLEWLALRPRLGGLAAAAAVVALATAPFARGVDRVARMHADGVSRGAAAWREGMHARSTGGAYRRYAELTAWLHAADAPPGPILVLGNPLAYWLGGRRPAIALPGGASFHDAAGWGRMAAQLEAAAPALVLLEDPMLAALAPPRADARPMREVLRRDYVELARVDRARWLVRLPR